MRAAWSLSIILLIIARETRVASAKDHSLGINQVLQTTTSRNAFTGTYRILFRKTLKSSSRVNFYQDRVLFLMFARRRISRPFLLPGEKVLF